MLVATNNCNFLNQAMYESQKVLHCIANSELLMNYNYSEISINNYLKSSEEMINLFHDIPEAIDNTIIIAKRCSFLLEKRSPIFPKIGIKNEFNELEKLSKNGLEKRISQLKNINNKLKLEDYNDRLNAELSIIGKMGFSGYFLIVYDFIKWSKDKNIRVGPGRGSGAGSLVAWALGITDIDPLRWGLIFERFLNPERISMPDFDIDFCRSRRDEVLNYVIEKYGKEKVAQIITFGKLKARASIRDVGRVFDMPYLQVDKIAKFIPFQPGKDIKISSALKTDASFKEAVENDDQINSLINTAISIEGLYRHASTHASGVVISNEPLHNIVPLYKDVNSNVPVTQFDMKAVEKIGLIKFDLLGLKTLTVIQKTIDLINESGHKIDISNISLDDEATFKLLSKGDTVGVFQLESNGMKDVLRGLKPDRFEDIMAVVALFRPGPMENIPSYINRKHGKEKVFYDHHLLEDILSETYGIMIYQEHVQQVARVLAGYSLAEADILRSAMGKKNVPEMKKQRVIFIDGAKKNNISEDLSNKIFEKMAAFAGYGFNKAHAASYAFVTYQTAWLKANYPVEFFAANMSLEFENNDKISDFYHDCIKKQIKIFPPNINFSNELFSVQMNDNQKSIIYALGAIKNVGLDAVSKIVKERSTGKFISLECFSKRMPQEVCNKKTLENLICSGALDCLGKERADLYNSINKIISFSESYRRDVETGQSNLFVSINENSSFNNIDISKTSNWSKMEFLKKEFNSLGVYLSSHPIDFYEKQLSEYKIIQSNQIQSSIFQKKLRRFILAGYKLNYVEKFSSNGNKFGIIKFSDKFGTFEISVFSDNLAKYQDIIKNNDVFIVETDVRTDGETFRLILKSISSIQENNYENNILKPNYFKNVKIIINSENSLCKIKEALSLLDEGKVNVKIHLKTLSEEIEFTLNKKYEFNTIVKERLSDINGIVKVEYF